GVFPSAVFHFGRSRRDRSAARHRPRRRRLLHVGNRLSAPGPSAYVGRRPDALRRGAAGTDPREGARRKREAHLSARHHGLPAELELRGKVVFVAGASRGIGFGIARAFVAEGAKVAVTGRNAEALNASARELNQAGGAHVCAVAGDMTVT